MKGSEEHFMINIKYNCHREKPDPLNPMCEYEALTIQNHHPSTIKAPDFLLKEKAKRQEQKEKKIRGIYNINKLLPSSPQAGGFSTLHF